VSRLEHPGYGAVHADRSGGRFEKLDLRCPRTRLARTPPRPRPIARPGTRCPVRPCPRPRRSPRRGSQASLQPRRELSLVYWLCRPFSGGARALPYGATLIALANGDRREQIMRGQPRRCSLSRKGGATGGAHRSCSCAVRPEQARVVASTRHQVRPPRASLRRRLENDRSGGGCPGCRARAPTRGRAPSGSCRAHPRGAR
jgi:hypothetical protein